MQPDHSRVSTIILNYNRTDDTINCLKSLAVAEALNPVVHVVDNGSESEQAARLAEFCRSLPAVRFHLNQENLGFAEANNRVLAEILSTDEADQILLLNNDTVVMPGFLTAMQTELNPLAQIEMVAARMLKFSDPEQVDNLGLTLFKSGFSLLRRTDTQPLLGPCAGCGLYTSHMLRVLMEDTRHLFDPVFFMYSEDFDLAFRAVLLGFRPAFASSAKVLHKGASSTGGAINDFVLYYNYRNSLFAILKNIPRGVLVRFCGWILTMQVLVLVKYTLKWSLRPVLKAYADFGRHFWTMLHHRRIIQAQRILSGKELRHYISNDFYDPVYLRRTFRSLWRKDLRKSDLPYGQQ